MARIVKAALLQAEWTGDKDSMIEKHERYAREAAKQGAQVMCFQELFYGPYFCQVQDPQYYSYTEKIPGGPTTERMQALAIALAATGQPVPKELLLEIDKRMEEISPPQNDGPQTGC